MIARVRDIAIVVFCLVAAYFGFVVAEQVRTQTVNHAVLDQLLIQALQPKRPPVVE